MTPQDEANILRFLVDLAQSGDMVHDADRDRVRTMIDARLRGDRPEGLPSDPNGPKRPHGGKDARRWPVRAWWDHD